MTTNEKKDSIVIRKRLELLTRFFRALGDPSRIKILLSLLEGEKNVGELMEVVGSSQGTISNHLACLKHCGFANARQHGKFVYYSIADKEVRGILQLAEKMIAKNAEHIITCTRVDADNHN